MTPGDANGHSRFPLPMDPATIYPPPIPARTRGPATPEGGAGGGQSLAHLVSGRIMLAAIVVLFASVFLILFLHLYLRWRLLRRYSHRRRGRRNLVFAGEGEASSAGAVRGLDHEVIRLLPVAVFSPSAAAADAGDEVSAECAVCLSEFEAGDKLRVLPRCGHRFHIDCIDMWFYSHNTCPLCRSAVERKDAEAAGAIAAATAVPAVGSSLSDPGAVELRIEVPTRRGSGGELGTGSGMGSPGSGMQLLRRLLSGDLRGCMGTGVAVEPDLERGETAEQPGAGGAAAVTVGCEEGPMKNESQTSVAP